MAITSVGYDGSVNETQWAKLIPLVGSAHYGVAAAGDWKVTPHATMDRGINIAVGTGWGHGILDTSDATVSLQGNTVGSGSRWDMVVVRRNWSGTGGTTQFQLVQGTGTKQLPARNTTPGTLDDQPIALVQFTAGQTAPTQIVDLRCWSRNGGMNARDELVMTYLKEPGTTVSINGVSWNCTLDANGNAVWASGHVMGRIPLFGASGPLFGPVSDPSSLISGGTQFLIQAGTTVQRTDPSGYARITFPKPFPAGLITVMGFNGDDWAIGSGGLTIASAGNSGIFGTSAWGNTADWVYVVHGYASGNNDGPLIRKANQLHRINWIAIGW